MQDKHGSVKQEKLADFNIIWKMFLAPFLSSNVIPFGISRFKKFVMK